MTPTRVHGHARAWRGPAWSFSLLLLGGAVNAWSPGTGFAQNFPVQTFTLNNGLKVLMQPDRSVPSICLAVVFHAGGKNERPGITGISHLFEHMMFNGSAKYEPKQFDHIIEAGGGYSQGFTTSDMTMYYEEFNPDLLPKVIDMEADRMRALKIDTENLEQERGIVKEERRVSVDDSPRSKLDEELRAAAFDAHPYGSPVVGWMRDLDNIQVHDCRTYFRTYYAPNNAILCLTGDFDPKTARPLIETAFRDIPSQAPPAQVVQSEDAQLGERRIEVTVPAEQPAVVAAYHIVPRSHPDFLAYDLLSNILGAGESSRLHQALVYERELASEVSAFVDPFEHAGLLTIWTDVSPGRTAAEALAGVDSVLAQLVAGGIQPEEVDKARSQAQTSLVHRLETNENRTVSLLEFELLEGDYKRLFTIMADYDKVKAEDVSRVARECLSPQNRTIAVLVPKEAG
jgi:predicted Zn-dependent peptidase